jgi:hypothetical protein
LTDREIPVALEDTLAFAFPDALWISTQKHSDEAYTVWILNLEYTYTEWVCHLGQDDRWTVSPVRGPWQNTQTTYRHRQEIYTWQRRKRKLP